MRPSLLVLSLLAASLAGADPSSKPLLHPFDNAPRKYEERYRILVDLDGDGKKDLLLSEGLCMAGNAGLEWTVYLRRKETFRKVGHIGAHPAAISFEADRARILPGNKKAHARIWVYHRASGSDGSIGYHRVSEEKTADLEALEIYPGDGGSDLGRAIYEGVFGKSPIPFEIEVSTTTDAGAVTWKKREA